MQAVLPFFQSHRGDITAMLRVCKHATDWETGKSDALIQYSVVITYVHSGLLGETRTRKERERNRERKILCTYDRKWIGTQPEPVRPCCGGHMIYNEIANNDNNNNIPSTNVI